jgi:exonuclease III
MKRMLVGLFALVAAAAANAGDLRIISWNIEDATPHSKAKVIADVVKENKADIVALQDVNVTPYNLVNDLTEAFGPDWKFKVTKSADNTRQLAIAWNTKTVNLKKTKVPKAGAYEETSVQAGDHTINPAQIAYFQKGAYDFFLINVNLLRAWDKHDLKVAQATALHDWIAVRKKELSGTENDFVVAGTFNFDQAGTSDQTSTSYQILEGNGLLTFVLKSTKAISYLGSWFHDDALMDGFALSKPAVRHFVSNSAKVLPVDKKYESPDAYSYEVSDHLPVIATFKTNFED